MSTNTDRNLKIVKGIHESAHFHPEMELIFVIEGNMTAEIRDKRYHLKKEDLILMNSGVTHSLEASQDTIFCCVRYSYEILSEVMENENCIFTCNSVNDTERNYEELRKICRELMYQYVKQTHSTQCFEPQGKIVRTAHLLKNVDGKRTMTAAGPTRSFGPPAEGTILTEDIPAVSTCHEDYFENYKKAYFGEEDFLVKIPETRRVLAPMEAVRESARTWESFRFES